VLFAVVRGEGHELVSVGPVKPGEEDEVGAPLPVRNSRKELLEDLHLARPPRNSYLG